MGFFSFLRQEDLSQGYAAYCATPGGLLLDVRTPQEYREGHLPGSRNLPLASLDRVKEVAGDQETPLFVYCLSGSRSGQAVQILRGMGYSSVRNIGGIAGYRGKVEYE